MAENDQPTPKAELNPNEVLANVHSDIVSLYDYIIKNPPKGGQLSEQQYKLMVSLGEVVGPTTQNQNKSEEDSLPISDVLGNIRKDFKDASWLKDKLSPDVYRSLGKTAALINKIVSVYHIETTPPKRELSRRNFLGGLGVILLAGTGIVATKTVGVPILNRANGLQTPGNEIPQTELDELLSFFQEYGIDIYNGPPVISYENLQGEKLSDEEFAHKLKILKPELYKYPKDYFMSNNSTQLCLTKDLKSDEGHEYGVTSSIWGCVYINTNLEDALKPVFHHEEFHNVDPSFPSNDLKSRWEELQKCDCVVYDPNQNTDRPKWFIPYSKHPYGSRNMREDGAMIAQNLMMPEDHKRLIRYLKEIQNKDPETYEVNLRKINNVKDMYKKWSNGKMNDQYWEDLLAGKIHEGYFS